MKQCFLFLFFRRWKQATQDWVPQEEGNTSSRCHNCPGCLPGDAFRIVAQEAEPRGGQWSICSRGKEQSLRGRDSWDFQGRVLERERYAEKGLRKAEQGVSEIFDCILSCYVPVEFIGREQLLQSCELLEISVLGDRGILTSWNRLTLMIHWTFK